MIRLVRRRPDLAAPGWSRDFDPRLSLHKGFTTAPTPADHGPTGRSRTEAAPNRARPVDPDPPAAARPSKGLAVLRRSVPDEDARLTDFLPEETADRTAGEGAGQAPDDGTEGEPADELAGEEGAGEAPERAGPEATDPEERERADSDDPGEGGVAPAAPTATWTPDGAACADCGAVVGRRWRDGDALVCAACRGWRPERARDRRDGSADADRD